MFINTRFRQKKTAKICNFDITECDLPNEITYQILFRRMDLTVAYLLLYNVAMAAGWTSIGWAACRETLNKGDLKYVFRYDSQF